MARALEVASVSRRFGGLTAVDGVSFETLPGEIFGVIGPNGAGKTTLFNVLSGALRPTAGRIRFGDVDVTGWSFDRISQAGLVRTFQNATVFKRLSARDNLARATLLREASSPLRLAALRPTAFTTATAKADAVLRFVGLDDGDATPAGDLPYGIQKRLGVAMALTADPLMLLLDEPAAGLNPAETAEMTALIAKLRAERGISIMLVEHDIKMIMSICDRILVLHHGKAISLGTPAEIRSDPAVMEAYLGADLELA